VKVRAVQHRSTHGLISKNLELIEEVTANLDNIAEANWFMSAMAVKMA